MGSIKFYFLLDTCSTNLRAVLSHSNLCVCSAGVVSVCRKVRFELPPLVRARSSTVVGWPHPQALPNAVCVGSWAGEMELTSQPNDNYFGRSITASREIEFSMVNLNLNDVRSVGQPVLYTCATRSPRCSTHTSSRDRGQRYNSKHLEL